VLQAKYLLLHGAIVLLVGLLCGIPLARAVVRGSPDASIRAWRVAHSGLSTGAVLLLAVAAAIPLVELGPVWGWVLVWSFVASGYGFAIALPLGAHFGHRGLTAGPPPLNRLVYLGNMAGVIGSLLGTVLLVLGACAAL
jgi:hypothetical protein